MTKKEKKVENETIQLIRINSYMVSQNAESILKCWKTNILVECVYIAVI